MDIEVVIATYYDWQALYINGFRTYEDHRISMGDLGEYLIGKTIKTFLCKHVDYKWFLEADTTFPQQLEFVVFES